MSDLEPIDIEPWTDGLDLFRAAGVTVVPIEDFAIEVSWVPGAKVLLIAADLSFERRRLVVDKYLPVILERRASGKDR